MEAMFKKWLAENGAEVEAMIFRSPKEWCPDLYIFTFRVGAGDWSTARTVPWGLKTFSDAQDMIVEAMQ